MSFSKNIKIKNGTEFQNFNFYKCDNCNTELKESDAKYKLNNFDYCPECSFRKNIITEKQFLNTSGFDSNMFICGVNPQTDNLIVWNKKSNIPWLKSDKQERHCKKYIDWRNEVFKRDAYTCKKCGQHGGTLNAHHIKLFSKYKNLRYDLNNGITLCEECHKLEHKNRR